MKQLVSTLITVCVVLMSWGLSISAAAQTVKGTPVDFRACNFRDGKSMKDLDKVTAKFRQYANESDVAYAAWTLTPQFQSDFGFDLGWLGAWPDGDAFGVSMEKWNTTGRSVQMAFNEVIDCSARHEMAMSLPLHAGQNNPADSVLMFYQCSLDEGKTLEDAYEAHLELGTAMKGLGSLALSWMMQPALGAGHIDYDYYHVVGFYRYSDMGATMELYANGGGVQQFRKHLGGVTSCQTPTVFDAVNVRAWDER
jgi:hypothetical protein